MKKKILLLSVFTVCFTFIKAQELISVWDDATISLPRDMNIAAGNDLIAISPTNEVYITGIFKDEFEFGTTTLESEFLSTYLAKYNADGSKAWAVGLIGSISPSAITVDENGTVYLAGTLADEVIIGSTDNNNLTLEGVKDGDVYAEYQSAAFIVQYAPDGKLQNASSYKPRINPDFIITGYNDTGARIYIYKLKKNGNEILAALKIGGIYTNENIEITGGYYTADLGVGFPLPVEDVTSGYIVSFDNQLKLKGILAEMSIAEAQEVNYNVNTVSFDISNNDLYVVFTASGEMVLKVKNLSYDVVFDSQIVEGDLHSARGALFAHINLENTTLITNNKYSNIPVTNGHSKFFEINSMELVDNGNIIVTGAFENSLAFDNSLTTQDRINNTYISILNTNDFSIKAAKSGNNPNKEFWSGSTIFGDSVYVAANDTVNKLAIGYTMNLQNIDGELEKEQIENMYINSLVSNSTHEATIGVRLNNDGDSNLVVALNTNQDQSNVKEITDNTLTFYPNPVKDIMTLSKASDINIYTLSGQLAAQAVNAKEINLKALAAGSYILTTKNEDGVQRLQFIKE